MLKNKKIWGIAAIAVILFLLGGYFVEENISDRSIVLGLGIDFQNGQYEVTAEIAVANAPQDEAVVSGSKIVSGKGETVAAAVQDIYKTTGRMPSLGQCCILVLGENLYKHGDVIQALGYFAFSDNFKDGTTVAACKKTAKELFQKQTTLDSYISLSLQTLLNESDDHTTTPSIILNTFMDDNRARGLSSYLPIIEAKELYAPSEKLDESSKKPSGIYACRKMALYRKGKYVGECNEEETRGFVITSNPKSFEYFVVKDVYREVTFSDMVTIGFLSKRCSVETEFEGETPVVTVCFRAKLRRVRTDTAGNVMNGVPHMKKEISDEILNKVKVQIEAQLQKTIQKSVETGCDFYQIATAVHRKYPRKWDYFMDEQENFLKGVEFRVDVRLSE